MDYKTEAAPKAWADSVPVFCAHDEIVDIAKLVPNPKNPNKHPDSQIQLLGRIIRQTGWRQPITVSKRSGFIVKGHGRLAAATLEGVKAVPVDFQNYANEAEEYADLVADNRIAELAEMDNKLLADIFADVDTGEIPMELTGYTEDEVETLVTALSEALHEDKDNVDSDAETQETQETVTQKGDLWILEQYRIVCGDATNEKNRELLFDKQRPDIVFNDTPYCSAIAVNVAEEMLYFMDKDPVYIDLMVRRFIKNAGKAAEIQLIRKGKKVGRDHFEQFFTE